MSRATVLLQSAATEFEHCRDPFRDDWLARHKVTYGECIDLSEQIAAAIRVAIALTGADR